MNKQIIDEVKSGEAVLVDVRTPEEYAAGHAKGAINFDSKLIEAGQVPDLDKSKQYYLYCISGGRAGRCKLVLQNKGFEKVENIGGLLDWTQAGGEVD